MSYSKLSALPSNSYYIYGMHAVFAALNNPKRIIRKLLCTSRVFNANHKILKHRNYEIVENKILTKILGESSNHQGIAALADTIFLSNLENINYKEENSKIVILDQITDSYNIGSIIRSACAFGIDSLILLKDNSPQENGHIAKTASGALECVKIIKVVNLVNAINFLKKNGFWIIGLDAHANQEVGSHDKGLLKGKIALILGAEDKGMRNLTEKSCDFLLKIPIKPGIESLNVSNSAAIMFYNLYNN